MQDNPLLEKIDFFFTSYPASIAKLLARPILDHIPCMIQIAQIPRKVKVFRFENYWL